MCPGFFHAKKEGWGGGGGCLRGLRGGFVLKLGFWPISCAHRTPLFSSHVQAHNWVLVDKSNKDSCLFSMWDNIFL